MRIATILLLVTTLGMPALAATPNSRQQRARVKGPKAALAALTVAGLLGLSAPVAADFTGAMHRVEVTTHPDGKPYHTYLGFNGDVALLGFRLALGPGGRFGIIRDQRRNLRAGTIRMLWDNEALPSLRGSWELLDGATPKQATGMALYTPQKEMIGTVQHRGGRRFTLHLAPGFEMVDSIGEFQTNLPLVPISTTDSRPADLLGK